MVAGCATLPLNRRPSMSTLIAVPVPDIGEDLKSGLRRSIDHAAHLLPAQGPIGVFIHHNTLHAFQHLPFEEAVVAAAEIFGTQPFMTEDAYREQFDLGRITADDVAAVLAREPNAEILPGCLDRRTLRTKLLVTGQRRFDARTVQWHLDETDFQHAFRFDLTEETRTQLASGGTAKAGAEALFAACLAYPTPTPPPQPGSAPAQGNPAFDSDEQLHPLLIRLCAVFLDQGMAYWTMPDRQLGFLGAVRSLLSREWALFPAHFVELAPEFRRQAALSISAEDVVLEMLERLDVPAVGFDRFLTAELLELPGWAGIMYRLQEEPDLAPHCELPCSLMDFLAVRLTLKAVATAALRAASGHSGARTTWESSGSPRLAVVASRFDALQILGIGGAQFISLDPGMRSHLIGEIDALDEAARRRILHHAYEFNHECGILLPLSRYRRLQPPASNVQPSAQVFFCIDEREESFRRNLEEIAPDIETHSAAGFFGVAINYEGIDDAHGVALCPVVVKPQHAVRERPVTAQAHLGRLRSQRRKLGASLIRHLSVASRSLLRGWASTALGGLALIPLLARILAPLRYGRLRDMLHAYAVPEPRTELDFIRNEGVPAAPGNSLASGFSTVEKIDRVAGVLGPAGLVQGFARLVVILGHGSSSLNNPHESAHDCGACGGRRGGPNARLFAAMANHPAVRVGLDARGIRIPADTWFVGGYHDTCNDGVDLHDVGLVPDDHRAELATLVIALDRARALDALERARRFEAASPHCSPEQALKHVQERAEHLSEPRPEYGHATNAVCIVGRRALTKGLFLDRRAFLISYDPVPDPASEGLARLLGAAVPVCAGINLEYYFSFVDNEGYGCGTKLPHNITGLIGVMNGPESDLRTGLPWQMVEIHEPVRILFVIETTPERVMLVFAANPQLSELLENRWIRLSTIDPETGVVHVRRDGVFERRDVTPGELPSARVSSEWFAGKLQHLPLARISSRQDPS